MNESETTCSVCLEANIARLAVYSCGHWNCFSCYEKLKTSGKKDCPVCRTELVLDHKENITQRKKSCLLCEKENPESVAFYKCGHSNCLKCYDLLVDFRVGFCSICSESLQLLWVEGKIPVFMKSVTGQSLFTLNVNLERTTGQHLKNMVSYLLGFSPSGLLYLGKQLSSNSTLSELKLSSYCTVLVSTMLRGD